MKARYHLAEINIARLRAPLDDPMLADFVAQLDAINSLADQDPGFVWRLVGDDGAASSYVRAYDDDSIVINMSVWQSIEALHAYVYRSGHTDVFRRRREWFVPLGAHPFALWWVPAGSIPTIAEGQARLHRLDEQGPSPDAFTFKVRFPPPESADCACA